MGCDIHLVVEKANADGWHLFDTVHPNFSQPYGATGKKRNYQRFAALAGVRGEGPEPKGLPPDLSIGAKMHHDPWGADAHSETWYPLVTACLIFANTDWLDTAEDRAERNTELNEAEKHLVHWSYRYFGIDVYRLKECEDYRVIMWFDN